MCMEKSFGWLQLNCYWAWQMWFVLYANTVECMSSAEFVLHVEVWVMLWTSVAVEHGTYVYGHVVVGCNLIATEHGRCGLSCSELCWVPCWYTFISWVWIGQSACREFCDVHNWQNGTKCMKVMWCHPLVGFWRFHPCVYFVLCFCSFFFSFFFLFFFLGMEREVKLGEDA